MHVIILGRLLQRILFFYFEEKFSFSDANYSVDLKITLHCAKNTNHFNNIANL